MKTVAVIPARMGSKRLPRKVMSRVLKKPLLGHLLDRIERSSLIDEIVVATSEKQWDDIIEVYVKSRNILCYRGREEDVLDRLLKALQSRGADIGVLVFSDCPLFDSSIADLAIEWFCTHNELDFVGNDLRTTYPPGMEVEVFSVDALADSAKRCTDVGMREHGTLYIRMNPTIYRLFNLEAPPVWRRPDLSLEVDTVEDMTVIKEVIEGFGGRSDTTLSEIIEFLDLHPELVMVNKDVPRRWKPYRIE